MKNLAEKLARKLGYVPQHECKVEQSRADMFLELSLKYAEMVKELPALETKNKMLSDLYERFQKANGDLRRERDQLVKDLEYAEEKLGSYRELMHEVETRYEALKDRRRKAVKVKKPVAKAKKRRAA